MVLKTLCKFTQVCTASRVLDLTLLDETLLSITSPLAFILENSVVTYSKAE